MRVLLVVPPQSATYANLSAPNIHPLGLGYIGAVLEGGGHSVRIINMDADKITEQVFADILRKGDFGAVGITTTTPTFNGSIRLTKLVKENSGAVTVLGGIHVTTLPEESIGFESVDFVIKGEGENTIVGLMDYLEGRTGIESVDGLYYKQNGRIFKNGERELIANLDGIPFPARHLFNNQCYIYPDTLSASVFPIITSRGCPAQCTYCAANCIFKRRFRARTPKNIVNEIEFLSNRFKAKEIHIWDDNFTLIKSRVIQIKEELKRRGLRLKFAFPNGLRIDCVDEEVLSALKEMGTYSIAFGVESGSQETLDKVKKGIKLERIEEAFKMVRKFGIEIWAFFIIGLPDEDERRIKETIEFAKKINPDIAKFHLLKPFPGTEVYQELSKDKLILDYNFDNYGIHMPPVHRLKALSAGQILNLQKQAYRSFYFRPSVLVKHLFRAKSFYRLKLNFITGRNILKSIIRR